MRHSANGAAQQSLDPAAQAVSVAAEFGGQAVQKDAYTLILESIEGGVYKPGDRLVESELAERLGVSRQPVPGAPPAP